MTIPNVERVEVEPQQAGERLDRVLAANLSAISRSRLQALIRSGCVTLDARTIVDPGQRVKPGETYAVLVPPPEPAAPSGEPIALTVVHEDEDLIVIDKPAGLVVHPAPGHAGGTLVNALIAHCGTSLSGIGGVRRPGIIHRLDKDTSGLLVVAKSDRAHQGLGAQFAAHGSDGRLERGYVALCWGAPLPRAGAIDAPIGRSRHNRTRMAVLERNTAARRAVTHYATEEAFTDEDGVVVASRLALMLETGRTHQIRVHLAHIGHPVLGDPVYGTGFKASARRLVTKAQDALTALDRQALHAARLGFVHPVSGRRLAFESPLPPDLADLVEALRPPAVAKRKPRRPSK